MSFLSDAFIAILNMSITASYVAIALIIARFFLKRTSKAFSYALWSILLFRLIFPFSFSSPFSLLGLVKQIQTGTTSMQYIIQDIGKMEVPTIDTGIDGMNTVINASLPAANPSASINPIQVWILLGTLIWLIGVAVLLIYAVISYIRLKKQISMATLVKDNIYETDLIHSPFVYGFLKPKIYLPINLTKQEREYILSHEQIHIERFDYLIKPVAFFVLVVYWFNPLMWLSFSLMTKDMEMSCDERVIQRMGGEGVSGYSSSLLALATYTKIPRPSPLAFGEGNVKARIKNILNYRKPTFWVMIVSTIVVMILAIILTSNPIKDSKDSSVVDSLLKNKTQYIGNNSKVVALIEALPLPKEVKRDSIELSTSVAPYSITINYSLEDDSAEISQEHFLRNSVLLFALIDNAEEITHMGYWNNKLLSSYPFKFTYTRAEAEKIVGGDVRQFAENKKSLAELVEIVQMIRSDNEKDVEAVQTLVEGFGKKLQMVSLTAPNDMVAASIAENYGDYITSELLQKWQAVPQSAPGRLVSSPWPERIEILRSERGGANYYTIYGEVIEVTSVELGSGGAASKRPITLTVQKINGRWLISNVTMGEYVKQEAVVYEDTSYGFKFYLPETWKNYVIIEEQWKSTNGSGTIETGPQLLIRHPKWSDKTPRQDIPIMIFTIKQWNALQKGEFLVGVGPIGPSKLGRNSKYVFALPARYNYAFPTGFKEVEEIISGNPLWPSK